MTRTPRSRFATWSIGRPLALALALTSCGDPAPTAKESAAQPTAVVDAASFDLDRAVRPGTDVALSLDGKRVRDAAIVTNALDAMKSAPETARKLEEIEKKCKLSLVAIWEELRFSAKRSVGEGITYIRLNIPAESVASCVRSMWTEVKATDIGGHAAWILPGEGSSSKPLILVTEGQTLVLGTESFVRDAITGSPPDDVAAHALRREGDELGRGIVSFDDGALTKVVFRITATADRFEMIAEPDLEDEAAATGFIALLESTWADANVSDATEALPKPRIERAGKKLVITARVSGDATQQARYLSGLSARGFSAFQRLMTPKAAPPP